jgi:DNA-binding NtrC family response regulator
MARGHVGIVLGVQSGFTSLCDIWTRSQKKSEGALTTDSNRYHHTEAEIVTAIKRLISLKRLCDMSALNVYFSLPNSDHMVMLSQFFQFIGEPLKNKEAVRLEAIQNLTVKNFIYVALDVSPSRFAEQLARLTLLCPKVDHVVVGKEPVWNHKSLVALKDSWKWISPENQDEWNSFVKDVTGRGEEELGIEARKDPLTVTRSPKMRRLLDFVDRFAETKGPVFLLGEEGVGKDLLIQRIKATAKSAKKECQILTCEADMSLESLQALLVADSDTQPMRILLSFEKLSEELQAAFLGFIQASEVEPAAMAPVIVCMQKSGEVAPDSILDSGLPHAELPPLRFRREDLELLIDFFIQKFNIEKKKSITGISSRASRALAAYDWPGNVRELEALIQRTVILKASGIIDVCDIPEKYSQKILSEIEYEDILRGVNKRLAPQGSSSRKETCYDHKYGEDLRMTNNSIFKGHIDQVAGGHRCDSTCQHNQESSFEPREGVGSMQKIEEFLDMLQASFKCTDEGVDFNTIVDRFENILILSALARTGWNRNRAAALLKLNRTTLVEKLKKKQLAQPGMGQAGTGPTTGNPVANPTTNNPTIGF